MAMDKNALTTTLQAFMGEDKTRDQAAADLADIIDAYIRTAVVAVPTVNVTGTILGTSPSGPVTGTCTATGTGSGGTLS